MMPDKVEKVQKFPIPKNKKEILRFLGMSGYYRPFIAGYAKLAEPLTRLLKEGQPFVWEVEQGSAFNSLKLALTTAPILSFPDFHKPFVIACDASDVGLGAILM